MTEKQYAEIIDAIDKAKQELLLKLTEIMNEPEEEENRCDSCRTGERTKTMDDLISRQAAIEAAYKSLGKPLMSKQWGKMLVALKDIPSAQRWISVTDEPPAPRHAVLVWCPERKNTYCAYTVDGEWIIYGSHGVVLDEAVAAWMYAPIP